MEEKMVEKSGFIPERDTGLSNHLWPKIFSWQLEGTF